MLYTLTLIILICVLILICFSVKKVNPYLMIAWMFCCCPLAWIEFSSMNFADIIEAWVFSEKHITNIWILGMTIEDFFFAPICGILFYFVYRWIDRKFNYSSSEFWKVICLSMNVLFLLFFFCWGSYFGRYQVIRHFIGIMCLIYTWDRLDLRQFFVVLLFVFCFSAIWDIWANCWSTPQQWFYRDIETLNNSKVYANWGFWWFKIGKGWFPLSIFPQYYISGGVFTYGVLTALQKKFINLKDY